MVVATHGEEFAGLGAQRLLSGGDLKVAKTADERVGRFEPECLEVVVRLELFQVTVDARGLRSHYSVHDARIG